MAPSTDVGFVFLHGAGLGAWIWDDVAGRMEHPCLAIDLPGRGNHAGIPTKGLALAAYVESALSDIARFGPEKLVIVAHSIGGIIGLDVAHALGNRIHGFAAVGASIPSAARSYVSSLPAAMGLFLRLMFAFAGTRPPESAIRGGLCEDLDEARTKEVLERFVPESKRLYTDARKSRTVPANSLYVRLKNDRALGFELQNGMIANLGTKRIADIDSGHLPMLAQPEELARVLNSCAGSMTI